MNKYYYKDFLVRKSDNLYTFAVGCVINGKLKVYGCHSNLELAEKKFNETKILLEKNYKSWLNIPEEDKKYFSEEECERRAKSIKFQFDNLMIIKLELRK